MWFYRIILWFCPASFRDEYSREMEAVHRQRLRQASALTKVWVWLDALADIVITGLACHWDLLVKDTRYALRTAVRSPGFSLTAITVAALGIAAATTVFSLADHILIRALPFPEPDRLVKLWEDTNKMGRFRNVVAPANYRDWKAESASFSAMAAYRELSVNLSGTGEPERLEGAAVEPAMFPILGVAPLMGRTMTDAEDAPGASGAVVLSYGYWQGRFGGDPNVIGRKLLFDGDPHVIIGVMPKNYSFPSRSVQIWTALQLGGRDFTDRRNNFLGVVARLRSGLSLAQAQGEMRAIGQRLATRYPKELENVQISTILMRDELSERTRTMLRILMAAALFVFLIAITNLANLFLARASARQKEIAVRLALGAGRARLVRQLLTESLLLTSVGGMIGTVLSIVAVPLLARLAPSTLPVAATPSADWRLLIIAFTATTVAGLAFGIIPALRSTKGSLASRSATASRKDSVRRILVVTQVAASIALISSTGLLSRALLKIQDIHPGFATENTLAFRASLPMPKYLNTADRERFYHSVLDGVRRLPGVRAAAVISFRPMGDFRGGIWQPIVAGQETKVQAGVRFVTPGYFSAMRIPLLQGRDIQESDSPSSQRVAVVSDSFIRENWPGENGIGKSFRIPYLNHEYTIIGVSGDIRFRGIERKSEPQIYFAHTQMPDRSFTWFAPKDFVVAASGDPLPLLPEIRRIVAKADPLQPISDVQTLTALVEGETASRRTQVWVISLFSVVAFFLSAVGIHGLLSFALSQRTQEIGLRRALGAQTSQVASLVFGEGAVLTLAGAVIGIGAAFALGKSMETMLFGISPLDPFTITAAVGFAAVMTFAGSLLPAIRAALIDPATALRSQ